MLNYIADGKRSDAETRCRGDVPRDQPRGWFVDRRSSLTSTTRPDRPGEIFGPVLAVIPVRQRRPGRRAGQRQRVRSGRHGVVQHDVDRATGWRARFTGTVRINDYQLDMNALRRGETSGIGQNSGGGLAGSSNSVDLPGRSRRRTGKLGRRWVALRGMNTRRLVGAIP